MDPFTSLITSLALWVGAPAITGAANEAGGIIGKYVGGTIVDALKQVFGERVRGQSDMSSERLAEIARRHNMSDIEQDDIKKEAVRNLIQLLNSPYFMVPDLDDLYFRLFINIETGMTPDQNPDYAGAKNRKAAYLPTWALGQNKLGELTSQIYRSKRFLFAQ